MLNGSENEQTTTICRTVDAFQKQNVNICVIYTIYVILHVANIKYFKLYM